MNTNRKKMKQSTRYNISSIHVVVLLLASSFVDGADRFRAPSKQHVNPNVIPKIEKYRYTNRNNKDKTVLPSFASNSEDELAIQQKSQPSSFIKSFWWNEMDRNILVTTLPLSAIFAIIPLASAIDLFWVNRLGNTLAVAGQAAANQVYSSAFFLFSFLPSVTATLVSKYHASGNIEQTQDAVCQALFFSVLISIVGASFMFCFPTKALGSILKAESPAMEIAKPYIRIRAFSFFPMLFSFVGFSAFRGMALVETSVKVTMLATIVTIFLEPIFIFVCKIGVRGAAMASLVGELISATLYLFLLKEKQLISLAKIFRIPPIESLAPLVKGGISLQIRSVCLNLTFLMGARKIQALDTTGVAASAHALAAQTFQLGGIFLGALGMASQTMVPQAMVNKNSSSIANAKPLMNRLLQWGSILGVLIGLVQLALLPAILKSSPLPAVRQAARVPALIAIAFQGVNGVVSVGEGSMMGTGHFSWLSLNVVLAALGYLAALRVFPEQFGLAGVWMSLSCFTLIRLVGVLFHLCRRLPSLEKEQQLRQTL